MGVENAPAFLLEEFFFRTGQYYDDTKRYIDAVDGVSAADRKKIFEGNVRKVYPRFKG